MRRSSTSGDSTRVGALERAARFVEAAPQQVAEHDSPIAGARAHVVDRRELTSRAPAPRARPSRAFHGDPQQPLPVATRADAASAATPPQPMRADRIDAVADRQREAREHRGDVLVVALADLVRAQHEVGGRRGMRTAATNSPALARCLPVIRDRTRRAATSRSPAALRSTTIAPSAINAGIASPIGEPFATLPPSVALLRMGTDAKRCQASAARASCGSSAATASVSDDGGADLDARRRFANRPQARRRRRRR